ncbi:amidohydrolase [Janibacter sp. GXQ6167]|uniref:amidohydrolase n=1 Tax=Janibacter sp. GXQ6167 TaxID=3240791 RepID=UPI003523D001
MAERTLVTGARLVSLGGAPWGVPPGQEPALDVRIERGVITEVGPRLTRHGEEVIDAGGRPVIPGLWDAHVHLGQWAAAGARWDLAGTESPEAVTALLADRLHLATGQMSPQTPVLEGFGYRTANWHRQPSTAELDAVVGDRPVVLISGDCHTGWLSSAAYRLLGEEPRAGAVDEDEWFDLYFKIEQLPIPPERLRERYARVIEGAAALGVVGIVDLEFADGWMDWPDRFADGLDALRVRTATYPPGLNAVIAAGLRTGQPLHPSGLLEMGPLKVISDGSLNTRTAYCCTPFVTDDHLEHPRGKLNVDLAELTALIGRAHEHGLESAVHAIGDAALAGALDAFEATGARGSIEHAQLVDFADLPRMARLGVRASVQPAHLLDDRDTAESIWPDRLDRCFAYASMRRSGVELRLGSDAPVAPLDPWLAMDAAVRRTPLGHGPWSPHEALTPGQALAASTDGVVAIEPGGRADLVLLDDHPLLAADPGAGGPGLAGVRVAATIRAGEVTYGG